MKSINKKKTIKYGNIDLPDEMFKSENVKLKVTAYLDLDVIRALKEEAKSSGTKYQTLMNQKLRDTLFGKKIDPLLRGEIRALIREELKKTG